MWNLNYSISKEKIISGDKSFEAKLENNMNIFINKVDNAMETLDLM